MAEHNEKGEKGEQIAANYLITKGYVVLETNWRFKNLEADIIARKGNTLVVAEVKTRSTDFFGDPETFVNRQKQQNIIRAANAYVQYRSLDVDVRFDIISVILNDTTQKVNHIEDAFYPLV